MNLLLKSATVIQQNSPFHKQVVDILIVDGLIKNIAKNIEPDTNTKVITLENLHVSGGWIDTSVSFGEPGFEERETIKNGLKTAAKSGFTQIVLNANTNPVIDTSSDITFVKEKAKGAATSLLPTGALTVKSEGKDLAELFDMTNAGAVAFSDYQKPIENANLLKIALLYTQSFNGLVCSFPLEKNTAGKGIVNEDKVTTLLGLKGIPTISEELQIARDLQVLEYTGGKLHIPTISTSKSVALIKEAKQKGLDVTCSVAIHNLYFTSDALNSFNTNFKVLPPLRTEQDCKALQKAVKDGTIDFVTSDHNPIDIENKRVEFDYALYGSVGLESCFGALNKLFGTEKTIEILTKGADRFNGEEPELKVGANANLTLFNPDKTNVFTESNVFSTSKNAMFLNQELKGIVYGVINNNIVELN